MALDKNQKQMVIIGIMVLVLIFVAMDAMKGSKKKKPNITDDASDAQPQAVPGAQAQPGTESNKSTGNFMPPDRKILDLQLAKIAAKSNLRGLLMFALHADLQRIGIERLGGLQACPGLYPGGQDIRIAASAHHQRFA